MLIVIIVKASLVFVLRNSNHLLRAWLPDMPHPTGPTMQCRDCGIMKPTSDFSRNGRKDGYRRPECRSCQHKRSKDINPNYQYTPGAIAARKNHTLTASDIGTLRVYLLCEQGFECPYCGALLDERSAEVDHKKPLSRGGSDEIFNLQVVCRRCNREKHSKTDAEYRAWLKNT